MIGRGLPQQPPQFMVVIRGAYAPVVAKLARGWRHREYRRLARIGQAAAPVPAPATQQDDRVLRLVLRLPDDVPA